MASGSIYLGSDSDDLTVTKVSERHLEYVKTRLAHHILESKDFSAEIHHVRGQPAQMVFSIGTQSQGSHPSVQMQTSNKILVKNLPPAYDEQHLQMFFEYEKGQIGQPVRTLTLNRSTNSAVIEFESSRAVEVVLSKRPITIMDKTLEVDVLTPYLEADEKLGSVSVTGVPEAFRDEIIGLHIEDQTIVLNRKPMPGDKVKVLQLPKRDTNLRMIYSFFGVKEGSEGIVSIIESERAHVAFSCGKTLIFPLSDIELVP